VHWPSLISEVLECCTFDPPGTAVTCAVSGGADSTALMALAVAAGLHVEAVHVDHGLRPSSAAEAEVVHANAARLGATFRSCVVHLADGPNLEARAREARYSVLPSGVLTGHTADDQAETVLINLLRGAAAAGLAAMQPSTRRPLLAVRRATTEAVCAALDLPVVHDESNDDLRFLRNRVRLELLPTMNDIAQRDIVPLLHRQATVLRDDNALLDELAGVLDPSDARGLASAPSALARRAVRQWLTATHPPDLATVDRVLAVARGEAVACDVGGGRRVERTAQRLRIVGPPTSATIR
jgi:tRNA(Ile)-lysidine synthase